MRLGGGAGGDSTASRGPREHWLPSRRPRGRRAVSLRLLLAFLHPLGPARPAWRTQTGGTSSEGPAEARAAGACAPRPRSSKLADQGHTSEACRAAHRAGSGSLGCCSHLVCPQAPPTLPPPRPLLPAARPPCSVRPEACSLPLRRQPRSGLSSWGTPHAQNSHRAPWALTLPLPVSTGISEGSSQPFHQREAEMPPGMPALANPTNLAERKFHRTHQLSTDGGVNATWPAYDLRDGTRRQGGPVALVSAGRGPALLTGNQVHPQTLYKPGRQPGPWSWGGYRGHLRSWPRPANATHSRGGHTEGQPALGTTWQMARLKRP